MHLPPLVALLAWIPIGVLFFRLCQLRVAILAHFFVGWALLPGAAFAPSSSAFPYWILPVCLPGAQFITKASVLGLAALVGMILFHRNELRRIRFHSLDVAIAVLCTVPLLSSIANNLSLQEGIRGVLYMALAWAFPILLGRHCFSDRHSLLLAAKAVVISGILYCPVCLFELFSGPRFYALLYGFQPYRWIGASRYFGFRPVGFMEDGNQLGIWMASSALIASALWTRGLTSRVLRIPIKWAALLLIGVTLLCQSVGSILLLGLLLPLACLSRRSLPHVGIAVLLSCSVLYESVQLGHLIPWRKLSTTNPIARSIAERLKKAGRRSLGWRLARDDAESNIALQRPLLGYGVWNWWQSSGARPWDFWLLFFGMYGAVGVLAPAAIFGGSLAAMCFASSRADSGLSSLSAALSILVLMSVLDSLLNGAILLPYLLIVGGLWSRIRTNCAFQNGICALFAASL
jgi:hypothetical protein